eukprot:CAMPEP_0174859246 /NCGR_PEP_ID=MMETSP1114-20130205/45854_1 /TAXON_ID=312471 /ORGANISM="Neobodo designis, Strain CCAP 1951/1" /LENGTH=54 /DNA_ID=CAMNT_0016094191 /DNA_START=14 /DNA_END=174 /DNA_ORIENTATION=+
MADASRRNRCSVGGPSSSSSSPSPVPTTASIRFSKKSAGDTDAGRSTARRPTAT